MAFEKIQILITENGGRIVKDSIKSIGGAAVTAGVQLAKFGAIASVIGAGFAIKQAADFEAAMLDVAKTTGIVGDELKGLSGEFIELTKTLPSTAEELAGIGAVAGQLGIQGRDNIVSFTDTVAKMASVTELSTQDAAVSLAQLSNVFQLPITSAVKLASALNEVANTTTANAGTLVDFSQRIGVVGRQIGLSAADVVGLSGTLKNLGFNAELAGTAVSKTFVAMLTNADVFAEQTGVSTAEFKVNLERDAIGTVIKWAEAIKDLPKDELINTLDEAGVKGARAVPVFLALAGATEDLAKNTNTANKAFKEGTSLQTEFDIQIGSVNNQTRLLLNAFNAMAIDLGNTLLPIVADVISLFKELAQSDEVIVLLELLKKSFSDVATSMEGDSSAYLNALKGITEGIIFVVQSGRVGFKALSLAVDSVVQSAVFVEQGISRVALAFNQFQKSIGLGSEENDKQIQEGKRNIQQLEFVIASLSKEIRKGQEEILNYGADLEKIRGDARAAGLEQLIMKNATKEVAETSEVAAESVKKLSTSISKVDAKKAAADLKEFAEKTKQITDSLSLELLNATEIDASVREANTILAGFGDIKPDAKFREELILQLRQIEQVTIAMDARNEAFSEANEIAEQQANAIDGVTSKQQGLADELQRLADIAEITGGTLFDLGVAQEAAIIKFGETTKKVVEDTDKSTSEVLDAIGKGTEDTLTQVLTTGKITLDDLNSVVESVVEDIIRSFVRAQVQAAFTKSVSSSGGGEGGGGFDIGGLITSGIGLLGFAEGGTGRVGGSGGTDSTLVSFMATPGEDVTVRTPAQQQGAPIPRFGTGGNFEVGGGRGGQTIVNNNNTTIVTKDQASFKKSRAQIGIETERNNGRGRKFN